MSGQSKFLYPFDLTDEYINELMRIEKDEKREQYLRNIITRDVLETSSHSNLQTPKAYTAHLLKLANSVVKRIEGGRIHQSIYKILSNFCEIVKIVRPEPNEPLFKILQRHADHYERINSQKLKKNPVEANKKFANDVTGFMQIFRILKTDGLDYEKIVFAFGAAFFGFDVNFKTHYFSQANSSTDKSIANLSTLPVDSKLIQCIEPYISKYLGKLQHFCSGFILKTLTNNSCVSVNNGIVSVSSPPFNITDEELLDMGVKLGYIGYLLFTPIEARMSVMQLNRNEQIDDIKSLEEIKKKSNILETQHINYPFFDLLPIIADEDFIVDLIRQILSTSDKELIRQAATTIRQYIFEIILDQYKVQLEKLEDELAHERKMLSEKSLVEEEEKIKEEEKRKKDVPLEQVIPRMKVKIKTRPISPEAETANALEEEIRKKSEYFSQMQAIFKQKAQHLNAELGDATRANPSRYEANQFQTTEAVIGDNHSRKTHCIVLPRDLNYCHYARENRRDTKVTKKLFEVLEDNTPGKVVYVNNTEGQGYAVNIGKHAYVLLVETQVNGKTIFVCSSDVFSIVDANKAKTTNDHQIKELGKAITLTKQRFRRLQASEMWGEMESQIEDFFERQRSKTVEQKKAEETSVAQRRL